MKKRLAALLIILGSYVVPPMAIHAAEEQKPAPAEQKPAEPEDKPLGPGWLSLDSSVGVLDSKIGEGKSALEKALHIGISGYLDTSYSWSSNHPNNPNDISGRYFDKDYNTVAFNAFHLALDLPEKTFGVGYHVSGDFGREAELLREATRWNKKFQRQPSTELRESYLTTTIPVGEGIQFKGGLFVTPLGTETLLEAGAYNDTISRSFTFNYAVPLRHLGGLFTYPVAKTLSVSGGLVTGWDNPHDTNSAPSFLGGVNFTPADAFGLASNIIVGPEQDHNTHNQRLTWSNVATIKPMDPLTLLVEYTFGAENKASTPTGIKDAYWNALAAVASYGWTDRFNTALRTEFFYDAQAFRTVGSGQFATPTQPVHNAALGEVTLTSSYKFTKMLIGRAEFRQDWANRPIFKQGSNGADSNQTTLAMQLIYTF
jgi:hypothetical protein